MSAAIAPAAMTDAKLTTKQYAKARELNEGSVLCAYMDRGQIRMETELGEDPFVWRNDEWRRMRLRAA